MSLALALKYPAAAKSLKLQYFCLPRAQYSIATQNLMLITSTLIRNMSFLRST